MRLIILIILVGLLLFVIIKPLVRHEKPSPVTVILLSVLVVVLGAFEGRWLVLQNEGTEYVKTISGNQDGHLYCQRLSEGFFDSEVVTAGKVYWDAPDTAILKYRVCQDLYGWFTSNRKTITDNQLQAVRILVHEAVHVGGNYDESSTECETGKQLYKVLKSMGLPENLAVSRTDYYWSVLRPRLPASYRGECVVPV